MNRLRSRSIAAEFLLTILVLAFTCLSVDEELDERLRGIAINQSAVLIYTSGTTVSKHLTRESDEFMMAGYVLKNCHGIN